MGLGGMWSKLSDWSWSLRRRLGSWWYGFTCKWWHRYNVVHVRTLPSTWVDRCDLIPHALFQILTDFVQKEEPFNGVEDTTPEYVHARSEMLELYEWWHTVYLQFDPLKNFRGIEQPTFGPDGIKFSSTDAEQAYHLALELTREEEEELEGQLTQNCCRLIHVMRFMWT